MYKSREIEENEPYLGPSWAIVLLCFYLLKKLFPTESYSTLWWVETYFITIICGITIFTIIKRYKYKGLIENNQNLYDESED